jgi:LmbE family N-acetylglucosaminyl deacetylase
MFRSRPRVPIALLVSIAIVSGVFFLSSSSPHAQVRPIYSTGAAGLVHLLKRLQTTASLLHTGAHPDDEDSALIAQVARGDDARVAYLSLNRGEGGQNIIGQELFEALGVIRTEELLQARTLDGGEQFFTTAFDFGFTKTMGEAAEKYGEERILGDMVRAIRLYRPLVIYARFSGTPADGHGQHQLSGKLTPLAFAAAGDPARFPEQLKEGLRPWQPRKLYVGQRFGPGGEKETTLRVPTGVYDAPLGRTYFEISMEGRSQHKSQEMGMIERRGPQFSGLRLLKVAPGAAGSSGAASAPVATSPALAATGAAGAAGAAPAAVESGVFDGLDTTVPGLAKLVGLPAGALGEPLAVMQKSAVTALADIDVTKPAKIIPTLATGLKATRDARASLKTIKADEAARADADFLLALKESEFEEALVRASGLVIDVLANVETAAPGESVRVTINTYTADDATSAPAVTAASATAPASTSASKPAAARATAAPAPVKLDLPTLDVPEGWQIAPAGEAKGDDPSDFMARFFRETPTRSDSFVVKLPADAKFTQPYWLEQKRKGNVFEWTDPKTKNRPFAAPIITGVVHVEIGGLPIAIHRPLQYRFGDSIRGEIRRDFNVVPALTVAFDSQLDVVSTSALDKPRRIVVRIQNQTLESGKGVARVRVPDGWKVEPADAPFSVSARGERDALVFRVTPAAGTKVGLYPLAAEATVDGHTYQTAMRVVEYPHIQTHRLYDTAIEQVRVLDLAVAPVRVGYVMGSGDLIPEAIKRMGLDVTLLHEEDLSSGDLSRFDTIVVGVRASESRPDFVANNGRLLQYVRDGGTLIVQYQQPDFVARNLAPFPGKMATRVTDEEAAITVLQPQHPLFNFPNKITAEDWNGWVQERNLYAFSTFDPQYTPLLETQDPGEPLQRGGELYARLGKGHYVYTSYAWFRQLPAGVPGAYRLFANLLSLSKAPTTP